MKYFIYSTFALLLSFSALSKETSRIEVKVGMYKIPPFFVTSSKEPSGIVIDLIHYLNEKQSRYNFSIIETSPRRRYRDFKNGVYDIIFFENPLWGWKSRDIKYEESKVFATGKDLYIAKKDPHLDDQQEVFSNFDNKTFLLKSGFHYGFLKLKPYDVKNKNLIYTNSHEGNIRNILKGKGDITVVDETYLKVYLMKNPEVANQIVISKKVDQFHHFKVLRRPDAPISIKDIEDLFQYIKKSKHFNEILNLK